MQIFLYLDMNPNPRQTALVEALTKLQMKGVNFQINIALTDSTNTQPERLV